MNNRIHPLVVPKYGMVMTEGTIAAWHVPDGSDVKAGDELVDIETEKVTNVYQSPYAGKLRHVAALGDLVATGALFGVIADAAVTTSDIDSFVSTYQSSTPSSSLAERRAAPTLVDIGGRRLRYRRMGVHDEVTPLLLLHGFGAD